MRLRLQVGQTIPGLQILGTRNACRSGCCREIARLCVVVTHGEERFAVGTFDTHYEAIFALPLDGSAVERSIHHDALHEVGVVFFAEIILPLQRRMLCGQNGELPLFVDAIPPF